MKEVFRMSEEAALELFARARHATFAFVGEGGRPLLRSLNVALLDGALVFHGADRGQKLDLVGGEAVAAVEEVVARLPSYFFDAHRACPATTYYRSAQMEGRVEALTDIDEKARALQAFMEAHQPEGGHAPITATDRRYRKVVDDLWVARLVPRVVVGKNKLGQHKGRAVIEKALIGLFERGEPGDRQALRAIREAHPEDPRPPFTRGPAGTFFEIAPDRRELEGALALVRGEYWNVEVEERELADAHLHSPLWIVAKDPEGAVIGTARATTDRGKFGFVYDVAVAKGWRGKGIGRALMRTLLADPAMRSVRRISLRTRDAQTFYESLGFSRLIHPSTLLVREGIERRARVRSG